MIALAIVAALLGPGQASSWDERSLSLPTRVAPLPTPLARGDRQFAFRGIKGWGWTPEQYLAEIPVLAKYRMNFLMNCYLSMFSDPVHWVNRWWEPIPEPKRKAYAQVIRECQKRRIEFCFALHPQLASPRPFDFRSEKDFHDLWAHYAWAQSLGVHWFSISLDDIPTEDKNVHFGGSAHAQLANRVLRMLRAKDPCAQLILCPTWYWGTGMEPQFRPYLEELGKDLDKDVYLFWTGDSVVAPRITRKAAESYRKVVGHRLFLWDNYPVNDANPTMHLGPVSGRDSDLCDVIDGYMSNPHASQNAINRIPLLTCADYAFNPRAYDPARSIGQSIVHLADTAGQRETLRDLIALYPGDINRGSEATSYSPVRTAFGQCKSKAEAEALIGRVQSVRDRLAREFPDRFQDARATVAADVDELRKQLRAKF